MAIEDKISKACCNMSELPLIRTPPVPIQNDVKYEVDPELAALRAKMMESCPSEVLPPSDATKPNVGID